MKTKVLVIGLDGATWNVIKLWINSGKLPTFRMLMENGTWGYLESTIPPLTIPAWSSIATGLNPKKLGFSTFMIKKGYKFYPFSFFFKKKRNIWDFLSFKNKKVCVVNVPSITSPYPINGYIVPGWLYIGRFSTYPPNLYKELNHVCNGYQTIADVILKNEGVIKLDDKKYIRKSYELLEKQFRCFKYLIKNKEWDFAFFVFTEPDTTQHRFWHKKEIILNTYKKLDSYLEELLSLIDKDTILFIVSDHGFGGVEYLFNINEWLIKEGYLKLKKYYKKIYLHFLLRFIEKTRLFSLTKKIIDILPLSIFKLIRKHILPTKFEELDIDWKNTKAFAYGNFGCIWLNVKGREPNGTVDYQKYDEIREEIIRKLKNLKLNGKRLNIQVFKKEEIYPEATKNDNLPDLIILPTDNGIQSTSTSVGYGNIFMKWYQGEHRLYGIFIAYGSQIKKGYEIKNIKIYDIAPTILHIFGLPIPNDMDGRVLMEIFEPDSEFAKRKPKYVAPSYYERISERQRIRKKISRIKK